MVISTQIFHPRGSHQGGVLGIHLENMDFGPRQYPGGRRRPPNSDREPILNTHSLRGGGKRYGRSRAHEGGYGKYVVNQGYFGSGQEGAPGLAPQTEPLLLQIPPQTIQEGDNTQEYQQGQKKNCFDCIFGKYHKRPWRSKGKLSGGSIRNS